MIGCRLEPAKVLQDRDEMVLRFLARFARVRIGVSSRNRFASTAYFAESQTTLFLCILFMGGISWGGIVREGIVHGGKCP